MSLKLSYLILTIAIVNVFIQNGCKINPKVIPTLTMSLNVLSAVCYLCVLDMPRTVYWIAAGTLTFTVTYWMK